MDYLICQQLQYDIKKTIWCVDCSKEQQKQCRLERQNIIFELKK